MEEKFDINTLLRMILPGYVFLLVFFSLRNDLFIYTEGLPALLTLGGLPIGLLMYYTHRCLFYCFGVEKKLENEDFDHIIEHTNILSKEDKSKIKENSSEADHLYYSTSVDYLLLFNNELVEINKHIRFLYTRMHNSSTLAISIILANCLIYSIPCSSSTIIHSVPKIILILIWLLIVVPMLFYLCKESALRVLLWRRIVIDNNSKELQEQLKKIRL